MVKFRLHSTGDASSLAALLLPQILPGILGRRALPARRLARLGATPDLHHGLLTAAALTERPPQLVQVRAELFDLRAVER